MTSLLLIAEDCPAADATTAGLAATGFRISRRQEFSEARTAVLAGVFDACLLLFRRAERETWETLAAAVEAAGAVPVIVCGESISSDDETRAYEAGAAAVLTLPVSAKLLANLLPRILSVPAPAAAAVSRSPCVAPREAPSPSASSLNVLRDFSRLFSHSLDERGLIQEFLLRLREIISVNRVALFLEVAPDSSPAKSGGGARLVCSGSVGLSRDLVDCFELSRDSGIGRHLTRTGQIVRADDEWRGGDPRILREFEILACETAIPISDRERTLGVALMGGRVTGTPFSEEELHLLYHLMEELGLAVRNSRLHRQINGSRQLFSDVLEAMTCGSLVVDAHLRVLHANRTLQRFIRGPKERSFPLDFAELPRALARPLHELVENGSSSAPFFFEVEQRAGEIFRATLLPLSGSRTELPQPALVLVEDFTAIDAAKRAEVEASNLRLISVIAKRFSHEIRNSLVPLTTHFQLFDAEYASPEFRQSLKNALGAETGRIHRFTEQMLFLAQPQNPPADRARIGDLLRDGLSQAEAVLGRPCCIEILGNEALEVRCHRPSLLLAIQEILLNAMQASADPQVTISLRPEAERLLIGICDNGAGFSREVAARATEPFFTTRNTGVGLGLTVAAKIIEEHRGRLEVLSRCGPEPTADLVIRLPLADS